MPRTTAREEEKKKGLFGGAIPSRKGILDRTAIAAARIRARGLRINVPESKAAAKKEGPRAEAAFSLFGMLKGLFGFLNEKLGLDIPVFDEKKGNVKLATTRTSNVTVADNRNSVSLDLGGEGTSVKVNDKPPIVVG